MRQPNKIGGGSQTNVYGLRFEQTTDLSDLIIKEKEFSIVNDRVFKNGKEVGLLCGKNKLYTYLFKPKNIDVRNFISKKLLPDEAILVGKTVYIIEKKFQSGSGSVDEKLQTCDFKKKQYIKIFNLIGLKVEYIYVLNNWFKHDEYKDVHNYILSVGCKYFFNVLPLSEIGL